MLLHLDWIRSHPSFSAAVTRGREFWRGNSPETQRMLAIAYIIDVLQAGGESITVRTTQTYIEREVRRNRNNQPISYIDREITVEKVVTKTSGIPGWIANKVMANASGLSDAMVKVMAAGYEVRRPGKDVAS